MLRLFTSTRFTLTSPLPPAEIAERLRQSTEPWNAFRLKSGRQFEGEVGERSFRIRRSADLKAFAIPFLIGTIDFAVDGGSSIRVHAKAPGSLQLAAALWAAIIVVWLLSTSQNIVSLALGAALAFVGYAIPSSLTDAEIDTATGSLSEVLGAPAGKELT